MVLSDGCTRYWTFDDDSGVFQEASVGENIYLWSGAYGSASALDVGDISTETAVIDKASDFNGTSYNFYSGADAFGEHGASGSLAFWVRVDSFAVNGMIIGNNWNDSSYYPACFQVPISDANNNQVRFYLEGNSSAGGINATDLNANEWYHFVFSWNTVSGMTLYKNGEFEGEDSFNHASGNSAQRWVLGTHFKDWNTIDGPLNGKVDEFGIWNRVLSSSEISELFEATSGGTSYPFGTDVTVDQEPNGLTLTQNTIAVTTPAGAGSNSNMYIIGEGVF
jgi:hypothetical protein